MDIPKLRLLNQQLANPLFHSPKELVSWMGAVQAQDYAMVKWAVGMRLASATVRTVEEALQKGEILRTHVMRPTWHLVAAEDIRWMLKLSARRIKLPMRHTPKAGKKYPRNFTVKAIVHWKRFLPERKG